MIKRLPVYLAIILLACGLNYFSTKSILYTSLLFIIGIILFLALVEPYVKKFEVKEIRTKECISFINNFLITLSINQSIRLTFENMKESFSKELLQQVKLNEHLDVESQIKQLQFYFNSDLFNVFLNLLDQYIYNGGEILKISQLLMFDARKVGESLDNHISLLIRKIVEFFSMWILTFLILIIMKISLNNFYDQISSSGSYKLFIFIFFITFFINTVLFVLHGFNLNFIKSTVSKKDEIKEKQNKAFFKHKKSNKESKKFRRINAYEKIRSKNVKDK